MSTSDEDIERLAARLRTEPKIWVPYAADMLLALKAEREEQLAWNRKRAQDIMTLGALVHDENGVEWKARAEAAEKDAARWRGQLIRLSDNWRYAWAKPLRADTIANVESIARAALEAKP